MANSVSGIKNSWSLVAFAKSHGKMQVGDFVNGDTGETFKSTIFTNPTDNTRVFVAFSPKLGVLSAKEIAERKDELQVIQCENKNGEEIFRLCKAGQNAWEDVDLGI